MTWLQHYNWFHHAALSAVVAALPVVGLLNAIAWSKIRIHCASLLGRAVALAVLRSNRVLPQACDYPFGLLRVR